MYTIAAQKNEIYTKFKDDKTDDHFMCEVIVTLPRGHWNRVNVFKSAEEKKVIKTLRR